MNRTFEITYRPTAESSSQQTIEIQAPHAGAAWEIVQQQIPGCVFVTWRQTKGPLQPDWREIARETVAAPAEPVGPVLGSDPSPCDTSDEELVLDNKLLAAINAQQADLLMLFDEVSSTYGYENGVYRFYHQSAKVYHLQASTIKIVSALRSLMPERPLNAWFQRIIDDGTGKEFELEHNQDWLTHTRPIVEAFFHARFMLQMTIRYARMPCAPKVLPTGWAALLYLFNMR